MAVIAGRPVPDGLGDSGPPGGGVYGTRGPGATWPPAPGPDGRHGFRGSLWTPRPGLLPPSPPGAANVFARDPDLRPRRSPPRLRLPSPLPGLRVLAGAGGPRGPLRPMHRRAPGPARSPVPPLRSPEWVRCGGWELPRAGLRELRRLGGRGLLQGRGADRPHGSRPVGGPRPQVRRRPGDRDPLRPAPGGRPGDRGVPVGSGPSGPRAPAPGAAAGARLQPGGPDRPGGRCGPRRAGPEGPGSAGPADPPAGAPGGGGPGRQPGRGLRRRRSRAAAGPPLAPSAWWTTCSPRDRPSPPAPPSSPGSSPTPRSGRSPWPLPSAARVDLIRGECRFRLLSRCRPARPREAGLRLSPPDPEVGVATSASLGR